MPKIVCTPRKGTQKHPVTFAKPLNQSFMTPESLLRHQSSDFYGIHFPERKAGGGIGVFSQAVRKDKHGDPKWERGEFTGIRTN